MRSIFKRMFAVVASAAMVITAAGCGGAVPTAAGVSTEPEAGGILLTAAPAERGDLALSTAFIGSVAPDQVVSVMPKMGGTVKAVNVTVGQQVKKGELLMTLDDKDVMPSYNQAKAVYDSTKAQMDQRMGSGYKSDLSRLDTAYDQAFDAYENAKGNVDIADNAVATARAELAVDPNDPAKKAALAAANAKADMADSALVTSRKYFNNARSSYDAMKTE
ncbi:MAG: biotin/lipoyl-binding protein, partial [Angelakisella sp.]